MYNNGKPRRKSLLSPLNNYMRRLKKLNKHYGNGDGYHVAYKPITRSCILFMFIEMIFIHCHSCVMFAMKSMSICNDIVNYDEIII